MTPDPERTLSRRQSPTDQVLIRYVERVWENILKLSRAKCVVLLCLKEVKFLLKIILLRNFDKSCF